MNKIFFIGLSIIVSANQLIADDTNQKASLSFETTSIKLDNSKYGYSVDYSATQPKPQPQLTGTLGPRQIDVVRPYTVPGGNTAVICYTVKQECYQCSKLTNNGTIKITEDKILCPSSEKVEDYIPAIKLKEKQAHQTEERQKDSQ